MKTQIQIQFPTPGVWNKMTMTAVYWDAEGYTHTDRYTQDDIPADQAPALVSVVSALVRLAEPWQASQVWATLGMVEHPVVQEDTPPEIVDAVMLTVEAVNDQGGRRIFTAADYPEFIITDPAAVAFFWHFTGHTLN